MRAEGGQYEVGPPPLLDPLPSNLVLIQNEVARSVEVL